MDFSDRTDFENVDRGLIAQLSPGVIKTSDGTPVWDIDAFGFLDGECPSTVNPSLWRQSQLTKRTYRDADGELLDGSHHYRLRLPPDPPAKLFWAVTIYNISDGTMPETSQLLPSINQFDKVAHTDDGSIELHFGPDHPDGVAESNWIQTVPRRAFICCIRFYGTAIDFYDQTWKPDDVVRLD
jgi:hypothetical protein